jgi:uncharacterized protein (TIGR02611 family)
VGIRPAFNETDQNTTVMESVATKLGMRDRIRAHPLLGWFYRGLVGVVGLAVIVIGIVMLPAPGPGWLVIFAGLGILSTEFIWARRVLHKARQIIHVWTQWVQRQSLAVRLGIGFLGLLLLAGLALVFLASLGWNPLHFG